MATKNFCHFNPMLTPARGELAKRLKGTCAQRIAVAYAQTCAMLMIFGCITCAMCCSYLSSLLRLLHDYSPPCRRTKKPLKYTRHSGKQTRRRSKYCYMTARRSHPSNLGRRHRSTIAECNDCYRCI